MSDLERIVDHAVRTWREACPDCSLPQVSVRQLAEWRGAQVDGISVVAFQSGAWCPSKAQGECYDPGRAAITHQHAAFDGTPGALGEADIEINGANFKWSADGGVSGALSLGAVLIHEMGHFLGLPHSSNRDALMYPHPVDQEAALPVVPTRSDVDALRALYPPSSYANISLYAGLGISLGLTVLALVALGRRRKQRGYLP